MIPNKKRTELERRYACMERMFGGNLIECLTIAEESGVGEAGSKIWHIFV